MKKKYIHTENTHRDRERVYMDGVLDGEASNVITTDDAMRNGEFGEAIIPPETTGGRIPDDVLDLPRILKCLSLHFTIGGYQVPDPTHTRRTRQIWESEFLEDGA